VIPPPRTAATTAALRRTTHLLVFGGGRLSTSRARIDDSPEGVAIGRFGFAEGRASGAAGSAGNSLVKEDSGILWPLHSTGLTPVRISTPKLFNDFLTIFYAVVTQFLQEI
jgi:hypothetical protein